MFGPLKPLLTPRAYKIKNSIQTCNKTNQNDSQALKEHVKKMIKENQCNQSMKYGLLL